MRLLLDTNIVVMLIEGGRRLSPAHRGLVSDPGHDLLVSTASLWEMAIKQRSGKLDLGNTLDHATTYFSRLGLMLLPLSARHATADPDLSPTLKDPFDRMIVAVAEVEELTFLTTDQKLLDHPLAWRP